MWLQIGRLYFECLGQVRVSTVDVVLKKNEVAKEITVIVVLSTGIKINEVRSNINITSLFIFSIT